MTTITTARSELERATTFHAGTREPSDRLDCERWKEERRLLNVVWESMTARLCARRVAAAESHGEAAP